MRLRVATPAQAERLPKLWKGQWALGDRPLPLDGIYPLESATAPFLTQSSDSDLPTKHFESITRSMKIPHACWFLAFAFLFSAFTVQADWMAGAARMKITPEVPVAMAGYASRIKPFTSATGDLWAKALVLEDETGKRFAILTTDLIGIYADMAPAIYEGITDKTGIQRSDVLLTWSHTHSGPRLTLKDGASSASEQSDTDNSIAYTKKLQVQLANLVEIATRSLQPVNLSWGNGFASFVVNRRQRTEDGIRLNPNPSGHVDRSLPCLKVTAADGKLMAALFQVACHNTTLGPQNFILCGDYSGFAQKEVEDMYPGANAMFMTGCAGNANPYPRGTIELARKHGHEVAVEVDRLLKSDLASIEGPLKTAFDHAKLTLQALKSIDTLQDIAVNGPNWLRGSAATMSEVLKRGDSLPTHYEAPVAVWQFGKDLTLVALSGEVVSGYVLAAQNAIGHRKLWVAAYCHDFFGYLPTAQIVRDGGYETRGLFNGLGWFSEKAEQDMLQTIVRLAQEAGREW